MSQLPDGFHILGEQPAATDGDGGRSYAAAVAHQQSRADRTTSCDCFRLPHAFYCATKGAGLVPGYCFSEDGKADAADQRRADQS